MHPVQRCHREGFLQAPGAWQSGGGHVQELEFPGLSYFLSRLGRFLTI